MKKIIIIAIIIAAAVAIFAVVAGQNDLGKSAEKVKAPVDQKVKPEDLKKDVKKDVKMPLKMMKMQKIRLLDKENLKKNIKNAKGKKGEKSDKTLNLPEKRESCGE